MKLTWFKWFIWLIIFFIFWFILFYNSYDNTWITTKLISWYYSDDLEKEINSTVIKIEEAINSTKNKEETKETILNNFEILLNSLDTKDISYFMIKWIFDEVSKIPIN